jgi:4-amino-4-deoxy-L-arabinose transferase-like glycosyltransferase
VVIFCIAAGACLTYAWIFVPWVAAKFDFDPSPGRDGYSDLAKCLLDGNGFRFRPGFGETIFRLPAYPMFLCAVWWLFGVKLWVVEIIHSLFAGGTSLLIYHMGKRYFGPRVGMLGGLAFALWPIEWVVCQHYVTEPLYLLMLTSGMVVLLRLVESPRMGWALAFGGIMGLASLVREVNLYLVAAAAIAIPCLPLARGRRLRYFLTLMLAVTIVALAMLPWVWRGYRLTGSVILPTTGQGFTLYAATSWVRHEDYQGDLRSKMSDRVGPDMVRTAALHGIKENSGDYDSSYWWTFMSIEDEVRADQVLRQEAIKEIQEDPLRFVRFWLGNVVGLWFRAPTERMAWIARFLLAPVLLLGAVGFAVAVRSGQKAAWVLLLLIVYFNAMGAVPIASVRYTLPAMPALLLLAARGLSVFFPAPSGASIPSRSSTFKSLE